ncbi:acetate--CoA ligase [Neptuniibacter sp. QD29_5]|uniref:acetate--CoA ligase n=1 Tax=Neptuniibacter sp. QD29_5 TaxID=3398207 RepID=UPI0039F5A167
MACLVIDKDTDNVVPSPNMREYSTELTDSPNCQIDGLPDNAVNICYEAVDRHLDKGLADKIALRWHSKTNQLKSFTYAELAAATSRFACVLQRLGLQPGDRVFGLAGRTPEIYISLLGSLKFGAVFAPLFSAFGPEPIRSRMEIGDAAVLVTTERLYRKKLQHWINELTPSPQVLLLDIKGEPPEGCHDLSKLLAEADPDFPVYSSSPDDMALLHFTSGTTGKPKGAVHVHNAVRHHIISAYYALDLHPEDIYWCTADPGWVTGISYGIIAPLCHGVTLVIDEAEFDPARWYQLLEQERVSVWYTAPTAVRMLMKAGDQLPLKYDLSQLRFMASVGEPLNPEAVIWGNKVFGIPFHDNWWQSETGGIVISNYAAMPIKPGSMGRPIPGLEVALIKRTANNSIQLLNDQETTGELAIKAGWTSMFRAYLNQPDRYQSCFSEGWYLSGDLARRDSDDYYWFVGRSDDVIKTAGHLIGPFEVESVLIEHPAVAEAAVIGIPDPIVGEIIKAYVALNSGYLPDETLRKTLLGHARKYLGAAVAPKEISFRENLPKTRSGKIMRRLLKARELGLPEGDLSTLESDEK